MPLTAAQKRGMLAGRRRGDSLAVLAARYGLTVSRVSELLAGKCRYCGRRTGQPFVTGHPACRAANKKMLAALTSEVTRDPPEYAAAKAARVEHYRERAAKGLPLFGEG